MLNITLITILSVVLPLLLAAISIFFVVRFAFGLISESRRRQTLIHSGPSLSQSSPGLRSLTKPGAVICKAVSRFDKLVRRINDETKKVSDHHR